MDELVFEFPKAKGIVVSGDIHGDFTQLVFKCCDQYCMTDTLIIVAGDCGFGFERPGYYENIYTKCNKKLSKANNWLLFIRGNHDNPAYFNLQPIKHRRWMTLPDYSIVKACGHTILCVGGATSIDMKNHPLRFWYYGHFHQSWHTEIDGVQYNMLDCMELRELR